MGSCAAPFRLGTAVALGFLSACMHGLIEALDLFKHELCCGSLGSDLLPMELKLLLHLDVEVR